MYCANCGKEIEAKFNVCPYCGSKNPMAEANNDGINAETTDGNISKGNPAEGKKTKKKAPVIAVPLSIIAVAVIAVLIIFVVIPNYRYNHAVSLMEEENFSDAIKEFEKLKGYKDSQARIDECRRASKEKRYEKNYAKALEALGEGNYTRAIGEFVDVIAYKDSQDQIISILEILYNDGVGYIENREFVRAYKSFEQLDKSYQNVLEEISDKKFDEDVLNESFKEVIDNFTGHYKDSWDLMESIKFDYKMELIANAKEGDEVYFGNYNGEIEWTVLKVDEKENRILLVSKYLLTEKAFEEYGVNTDNLNWDTCSLRDWLNGDFYYSVFNMAEKEIMLKKITKENELFNLEDDVFLLSIEEVEKYFSSEYRRKATYTDGTEGCWWTCSHGDKEMWGQMIISIDESGKTHESGMAVTEGGWYYATGTKGVRPAIWVSIPYGYKK